MSVNAENWNPAASARDTAVSVDLQETDAGKAIERHKQNLPESEDGGTPKKPHYLKEASAEMKRRLNRQQRVFDQQRADDQAKYQRSISRLEKKIDKLSVTRAGATDDDAGHTAKMADLQKQLEAALEEGNAKKVADLQVKITQTDGAYWHAKTVAAMQGSQARDPGAKRQTRTRTPDPDLDDEDEEDDEPAPQRRAAGQPSPAAKAWREANKSWYLDPDEFAGEIAYTNTLYQRAIEEGEEESPELFERITKKLQKRFPDVEIKLPKAKRGGRRQEFSADDEDDEEEDEAPVPRNRRAAPVVNVDRGDDAPTRGRVRLSNDDLAMMTKFGLDNQNPVHIKRWAAEKANSAAEEA